MLTLESPAFQHEYVMAAKYTCDGEDVSPPLKWKGAPAGTKSFVLIVDDPDAPDPKAPKMTWVHWVVYNLPANATGLEEGAKALPSGTGEGMNDWKRTGYGGPCPPIGRHRYFFKLYALDTKLQTATAPGKREVETLMKGHILAEAKLIGMYEKSGR